MRTIAHLSDVHFDRIDPRVVEGVVADVQAQQPTVVVMSGDFTQRARARQYRNAAAFMTRLPSPQIVVPGNHDIPLFDIITRFFWPLRNYHKFITKDMRPSYQDQELLLIGVNTARSFTPVLNGFWKDGKISEEQLLDIKLRCADLPPDMFKVVVTHHPFIPPPGERVHGIVHRAREALDQMEACGIDMCLAGHLHLGYSGDVRTHHEAVKRSILSVQAGTATSTRRRGHPPEPNAYNLITLERNHVTIQVRAWTGTKFDNAAKTIFMRTEGAWHREA